ncbi:hypothetical protein BJV82DRAFT_591444 [Fennellomyces sp. T-0311]|nr:hypothetical protein BJV82DRAFT_591444 [Fennellomyces sp. T-0311]
MRLQNQLVHADHLFCDHGHCFAFTDTTYVIFLCSLHHSCSITLNVLVTFICVV